MSNNIIQYYRNYVDWRVCTITLGSELTAVEDLLSSDDLAAIGDRPIARIDIAFQDDAQSLVLSHSGDAGPEGQVTTFAGAGPGRWVGPPVINPHRKLFLAEGSGGSSLKLVIYFA